MNLTGQYGAVRVGADRKTEAAVIFQDVFRCISAAGAQIERVPRSGGDTALPGGKPVVDSLQQGSGQPHQAVPSMC